MEADVSVRFLGYGSDEANAINDALKKEEINKVDASPLNESPLLNKILCLSPRKGSELNHDLFSYYSFCLNVAFCKLFLTIP